jgi:hypothetical protein
MQSAALLVREVITFVVCNEVENRPLGQERRLVEHQTALFRRVPGDRSWAYCAGFRCARQAFIHPRDSSL